jgi:hypothetical protein
MRTMPILVTNLTNFWSLANGTYLHGDYTMTAWTKNIDCLGYNMLGKLHLEEKIKNSEKLTFE